MDQIDGHSLATAFTPLAGLTGGILIGLSAVLLMGGLGRVAGITSIFSTLLGRWKPDNAWPADSS